MAGRGLDFRPNSLYYGDCLDVLREWPAKVGKLVYLDPPFNSKADYNVLYGSRNGASAQVRAFSDTCHWGEAVAEGMEELERAPARLSHAALIGPGTIPGESGRPGYVTTENSVCAESTSRNCCVSGSIRTSAITTSAYVMQLRDLRAATAPRDRLPPGRVRVAGGVYDRLTQSDGALTGRKRRSTSQQRPPSIGGRHGPCRWLSCGGMDHRPRLGRRHGVGRKVICAKARPAAWRESPMAAPQAAAPGHPLNLHAPRQCPRSPCLSPSIHLTHRTDDRNYPPAQNSGCGHATGGPSLTCAAVNPRPPTTVRRRGAEAPSTRHEREERGANGKHRPSQAERPSEKE